MQETCISVSRDALLKRINRKLAPEQRCLRIARSAQMRRDVGEIYLLDVIRNFIVERDVDIETRGRELRVLKDYESLVLQ